MVLPWEVRGTPPRLRHAHQACWVDQCRCDRRAEGGKGGTCRRQENDRNQEQDIETHARSRPDDPIGDRCSDGDRNDPTENGSHESDEDRTEEDEKRNGEP